MKKLMQGFREFRTKVFTRYEAQFRSLAEEQHPRALLITCADSRVMPTLMLQADPGDLFVCRNAGNIVPPYEDQGGVAATVEYAVDVLKLKHIIVLGHSDCGAMKAVLDPRSTEQLPAVRNWLRHSERARRLALADPDLPEHDRLHRVTEHNVLTQLEHLEMYPSVAAAIARQELELYGWVYDIPTGQLRGFDPAKGEFAPLETPMPAIRRRWALRTRPAA